MLSLLNHLLIFLHMLMHIDLLFYKCLYWYYWLLLLLGLGLWLWDYWGLDGDLLGLLLGLLDYGLLGDLLVFLFYHLDLLLFWLLFLLLFFLFYLLFGLLLLLFHFLLRFLFNPRWLHIFLHLIQYPVYIKRLTNNFPLSLPFTNLTISHRPPQPTITITLPLLDHNWWSFILNNYHFLTRIHNLSNLWYSLFKYLCFLESLIKDYFRLFYI